LADKKTGASSPRPTQKVMIWDFREELELSPGQTKGLQETIDGFKKKISDLKTKRLAVEQEIDQLLRRNATESELRKKLTESAAVEVEMRIADFLTARKIDQSLTAGQLKLWKEIQEREIKKLESSEQKK